MTSASKLSMAETIFFFLGRDFHGVEKETVAPFSMSFPSFLILSSILLESPVAVNTLVETHFNGIFIPFNASSVTNFHTLYAISHP